MTDTEAEIEALKLRVRQLETHLTPVLLSRSNAERLHKVLSDLIKEIGGCDHSVGICCCEDQRALFELSVALSLKRYPTQEELENS